MNEPFIITVIHKGAEREFEATLQVIGYTHRFSVMVDGTELYFERDEEGRYRAVAPPGREIQRMDAVLLQSIAREIENILA
ncbi:MAG: hypothetical protein P4L51_18835 [Puia sp.]|nr:hypothetical protein [Puia sp.]